MSPPQHRQQNMAVNNKIVEAARSCLNTPFVHQGRVAGAGLDCAGLIVHVAKELGFQYEDVKGYPRLPFRGMLEEVLNSQPCLKKINKSQISAGDLMLVRFTRAPQHLGIYTGNGYMIHTFEEVGKVVEHRLDSLWLNRLIGVYRFG